MIKVFSVLLLTTNFVNNNNYYFVNKKNSFNVNGSYSILDNTTTLDYGQSYSVLRFRPNLNNSSVKINVVLTNQEYASIEQINSITGDYLAFNVDLSTSIYNNIPLLFTSYSNNYTYCYLVGSDNIYFLDLDFNCQVFDNNSLVRIVNYSYNGQFNNKVVNLNYTTNKYIGDFKYTLSDSFNLLSVNNVNTYNNNNIYYFKNVDENYVINSLIFTSNTTLNTDNKYYLTCKAWYDNDFSYSLRNVELNISNSNLYYYSFFAPMVDGIGIGGTETIDYLEFTIDTYSKGSYVPSMPGTPTTEVLDLNSLIFTILTMPFSFLSTCFNFTFFEGTPYAFNVSTIILSIISIVILLFIIKLIMSMVK